jgi:hypothetical protein
MKTRRKIIIFLCVLPLLALAVAAWGLWGGVSNPADRETIGGISVPLGFSRVEVGEGSFGAFLRDFPLMKRGSHMRYYDGRLAYGQIFGYAVLDLPMLANTEQCADAVMRMRAEYLWKNGHYGSIHFHSVSGLDQKYFGGNDRQKFEHYLRTVYGNSNTFSLRREMERKPLAEISPGDVLVYESPGPGVYGHAVLVVDVAINPRNGKKAVMLAQSSTPALTMHVIRNIFHPLRSPWVILDADAEGVSISGIHFGEYDLRGF